MSVQNSAVTTMPSTASPLTTAMVFLLVTWVELITLMFPRLTDTTPQCATTTHVST